MNEPTALFLQQADTIFHIGSAICTSIRENANHV